MTGCSIFQTSNLWYVNFSVALRLGLQGQVTQVLVEIIIAQWTWTCCESNLCTAGLEMIINIDQANYVKDAGETAGIRLVVHGGKRMPFPEDEGITVSPGHSTSLGLQKVSTPTCHSIVVDSIIFSYF